MQENYTAKTYTVSAELEEVTNIMDALKAQTKCIQALVEETQSESAVMKQELSKAKKSVSFSNVEYSALGFWVAASYGKTYDIEDWLKILRSKNASEINKKKRCQGPDLLNKMEVPEMIQKILEYVWGP